MADISKIILPGGSEYDLKDAAAQRKITASGVLQGDGNGGVTAKTVDTTPTANSTNLITSGAVKTALDNQVKANPTLAGTESDLTGLEVGGTKYKVPSGGGGALTVTTPSISSLPYTINNAAIKANHRVVKWYWSQANSVRGILTCNTSDGSLTITGTLSQATTLTLTLVEADTITVT